MGTTPWLARDKREAQAALNFLKHSRRLREASARLWLEREAHVEAAGAPRLSRTVGAARGRPGPAVSELSGLPGGESRRQSRRGRANPPRRLTGRSTPSELFLRRRTSLTLPQATLEDRFRSSRQVVVGPSHRERPETRCCAEC